MSELASNARDLFGITLSAFQVAMFDTYAEELIDWNSRFNLTAIADPKQINIKHFLDSLSCTIAMRKKPAKWIIDIGTGAGFPGLPLKILDPNVHLTLVESVGKKAAFCEHICQKLGFNQIEIIQERAEKVGHNQAIREQADWAVARAVASLPVLVEYLLPLIHLGGHALAMKGENAPAEVQIALPAIKILGGVLKEIIPVNLPGVEEDRYLVVVEKVASTPERFPRRVGIPAKRPLGID